MTLRKVESLYSEREVRQYLQHIHFPGFAEVFTDEKDEDRERSTLPRPTLATLTLLQQHHLLNIPFENTSIHYESSHSVSINPKVVLQRFCSRRMGGYCMQHNVCLLNVLRYLGYKCYAVAGRVLERALDGAQGDYEGFGHMIILVLLPNHLHEPQQAQEHLYAVDVGYGAQGPLRPLLLSDGHVEEGRFGERHRLVRLLPPESAFEDNSGTLQSPSLLEEMMEANKLWHLQHAKGEADWQTQYSFLQIETFPNDFEKLNFATSKRDVETSYALDAIEASKAALPQQRRVPEE
ncbi:ARYLAMINE N-ACETYLTRANSFERASE 4-RELATED [Ceraceosorus bombacis]|uniref:ARYLAMINE N-ACETYLTRANSFERASE 4-RELATED n=1 Tax=Ceraceosorus bombacis TaxID=401625 RepID=A0A0P1BCJ4_9BASI|nr:ARYLAMINE N-ACETYLTRANSFERASE 4-RELATED [Ceraceosorus bombacis]